MHGELLDWAGPLRALGVSRNATDALSVIVESCRDHSRCGTVPRERIANKLYCTDRHASRAVAELVDRGLVAVTAPGGGRGRRGVPATYRVADIAAWVHERRPDPGDTQMSSGSAPAMSPQSAAACGQLDPGDTLVSSQSPSGMSPQSDPARSRGHPDVTSFDGPACGQLDPCDISGRLRGHPDVTLPVPVTTPVGTTDVTTGPRATQQPVCPPAPAPPPGRSPGRSIEAALTVLGPVAPRCLEHADLAPGVPVPDCHSCAELRRAWSSRRTELVRAEARTRRDCRACDELGWLHAPSAHGEHVPVEPAVRCRHTAVERQRALTAPAADTPPTAEEHSGAGGRHGRGDVPPAPASTDPAPRTAQPRSEQQLTSAGAEGSAR